MPNSLSPRNDDNDPPQSNPTNNNASLSPLSTSLNDLATPSSDPPSPSQSQSQSQSLSLSNMGMHNNRSFLSLWFPREDKPPNPKRKEQTHLVTLGLNRCMIFLGFLAVIVATVGFIGVDENRSAQLTQLLRTYTDDPTFRAAVERIGELRQRSLLSGGIGGEDKLRPGEELFRKGRRAQSPVVLVPGVTSSTLELWQGHECAKKGFRDIYWGGGHMVGLAFRNHTCWLQHLMLDNKTWEDPQGIKMRSGSGYSATDYLFPGYWVWGKIIHNLADVGYDPSNMLMMSYDWRLTPQQLEKRDGYFTALKLSIEFLVKRNGGKRVALVAHSMGSLWLHFLFNMVEREEPGWTEKYVKKYINIAGPMLGVPKSLGALVSGEMKDIADIGQLGQTIMARFFSHDEIVQCFRSIGSVPSMLPCGGSAVWDRPESPGMITFDPPDPNQNKSTSPQRQVNQCPSHISAEMNVTGIGNIKRETSPKKQEEEFQVGKNFIGRNRSADEALSFLENAAPEYMDLVKKFYAIENGRWQGDTSDNRTWMHPYLSPLPPGGHLEITCMYGLINESHSTEVGYNYNHRYPLSLDFDGTDTEKGLKNGVWLGQGDGSVPLVSLGYVCAGPWKNNEKGFNPSGHKVKVREYLHEPLPLWESGGDLRGGERAASHVEILGNKGILRDVVTAVTEPLEEGGDEEGSEFYLGDRVHSDLWDIVKNVDRRRREEERKWKEEEKKRKRRGKDEIS